MANKIIREETLVNIADSIRGKLGSEDKISPNDMPGLIDDMEVAKFPEEAFIISGNCDNRFRNDNFIWFAKMYGDKITTSEITTAADMFENTTITNIPFELNFANVSGGNAVDGVFGYATKLEYLPKINNCAPKNINEFCLQCYSLKEIPQDFESWFDWKNIDNATAGHQGSMGSMFAQCRSIRSIPMNIFKHYNPKATSYTNFFYYRMIQGCYALDEMINVPVVEEATITNNAFSLAFSDNFRLKDFIFETDENGNAKIAKWKSITMDLTQNVGVCSVYTYITKLNIGITKDKYVKDDATYQALKNDPDWFTDVPAYSRYNHDSAVRTINSLPDTSAYLATAGGTNTIQFKGAFGSKTDGGAINTLTAEEIAVATAKGWTVSLK